MPLLSSNSQDPIEVNLTAQINQLRKQYLAATADQEKEGLRKSLKAAVDKLFDLRHAAHAKQVDKLDSELKQAKELLKKRSDRKDEIVERRMAELLETPDDLAWNPGPLALQLLLPCEGTPRPTGSLYVPIYKTIRTTLHLNAIRKQTASRASSHP